MAFTVVGRCKIRLLRNHSTVFNQAAQLHKQKRIYPALTSHRDWQFPETGTHEDHYRKQRSEEKSFGWARELLEYRWQKEQEAKANEGKPPKEPHMIHVVTRVVDCKGRPWWEKQIVDEFGLTQLGKPVPLKNTPDVNRKLKEINHLLIIKPLTFPHGIPEDESDYKYCQLNGDGELIVKKSLKEAMPYAPEHSPRAKVAIQRELWMKDALKKRERCALNEEFFKPNYYYERNQDGKEERYKKYGYGKLE